MPTSNDSSSTRDAARPAAAAPSDCVYVIQLHGADRAGPPTLVGRLEHVMSGRRHDFDTGAALLACLAQEQAHVLTTRSAKR